MSKIITVANNKGGVLKTTMVINLAALLGLKGKKVLIVDLDHQSNLAATFGMNGDNHFKTTIADVLMDKKLIKNAIQKNVTKNMDLLPSSTYLFKVEEYIIKNNTTPIKQLNTLKIALKPIIDEYDYIFLDTTPGFNKLTQSACFIANTIIVPSQMESYSVKGVIWMNKMLEEIKKNIDFIVPTLFDARTILHKEGLEELKQMVQSTKIKLTNTKISRSIAAAKAIANSRMPVVISNSNSNTTKQFKKLLKELDIY